MNIKYIYGWRNMKAEEIYDTIIFFRKFIDEVREGHSFSPYLYFAINHEINDIKCRWKIIDLEDVINPEISIKPIKALYEDFEDHLIVRDFMINLERNIELYYNVYLPQQEDYEPNIWSRKEVYRKYKELYPEAFKLHEKRVECGRKIGEKYGVDIEEVIEEDGNAYQRIVVNVSGYSWREKLQKIFELEKMFIELYSSLLKESKDKFIFQWKEATNAELTLIKIINLIIQITRNIPQSTNIENIQFEKSIGPVGGKIDLNLSIPHMEINTNIYVEIERSIIKNNLIVTIHSPKSNIILLLKERLSTYQPQIKKPYINVYRRGIKFPDIANSIAEILDRITRV